MINTKTNAFQHDLTELVNDSGLPPANVRLVMQNILSQVLQLEKTAIQQEQQAEQTKDQTTEEDE